MKTLKDLEKETKEELQTEKIAEKKELLKERIREIESAESVLMELKGQYKELLEQEI